LIKKEDLIEALMIWVQQIIFTRYLEPISGCGPSLCFVAVENLWEMESTGLQMLQWKIINIHQTRDKKMNLLSSLKNKVKENPSSIKHLLINLIEQVSYYITRTNLL
jgi:hypothetical protein